MMKGTPTGCEEKSHVFCFDPPPHTTCGLLLSKRGAEGSLKAEGSGRGTLGLASPVTP